MKKVILFVILNFVALSAFANSFETDFYVDAQSSPMKFEMSGLSLQQTYTLECDNFSYGSAPIFIVVHAQDKLIHNTVLDYKYDVENKDLKPFGSDNSISYEISSERAQGECRLLGYND